ncbi:SACE_7040 family transcriptional regulator [Streptacidiphilus carbonis]|uniref:SACE_7040 family transcriptional regulator n=1 Tax=Streptacidiphilus carbonis TaxID=105422 RepID=UPI0005A8B960|nr:TetR/AcrR family transcriptional regulator [Streptacidiphilus carbonis]
MPTPPSPVENPRRQQIRREAARLFAARGFLGVGVDEIGRAVGISGPGLYRHFAGKDAMLADLLVGISERLLEEGRRRVDEAADAPTALDALLQGHIDFALDESALITLHDRELLHLPDEERHRVRSLQRQYVELWVGVAGDSFPGLGSDARAAVHAVFGLLNSTPHSAVGQGADTADRTAMAALLHRLALGALAAAAAEPPRDA